MLRRKTDTEKLAPISCANAEAEEGYREQNKNTENKTKIPPGKTMICPLSI